MVVNMVCMVNDFVSMVLSVGFTMLLCAPVYFLMVSRIHKRFVSFDLHDDPRLRIPNHGQLVSAALLHRRRPHLRGDPLEKRLGVEGENDGCMDDLKPSVQWSQSSAHLVLLGHL